MTIDWNAIRDEFPAVHGLTYLDTACFGQLARRTTEAVARHFTRRDEHACHDFLSWFDDADRTRGKIARLINASADDIAFVPNASTALATLLAGIDWRTGDRVVTIENEFPNNLYAPAALGGRGVEFIEAAWDDIDDALTDRTRLVALSTASYATGFRPPIETISARLRERGIVLFVDATQSAGAIRFDVQRVQPDVLAVHGYKWLLCPNGAGFMYVRPDVREWLRPNVVGWRSHYDWRNVDNLHHGTPQPAARAEKYEGGMLPFALIYAMEASVSMLLEIGPEQIERRVMALAARLREILCEAGGDLPDYESHIVTARFSGVDASALQRRMAERNVLISARHGSIRVSAHIYNNEADLEKFRDELDAALRGRQLWGGL